MSEMHIGALVAISMTDSCKLRANLATRFYDVVDQQVMETEKAYKSVIKFLEDELGEDTKELESQVSISTTDGGEMAEGRSSRFNNYLVIKLKNLLIV